MEEIDHFLFNHPEVLNRGMNLFEDIEDLKSWLLDTGSFVNGRVIDQPEKEILLEIGRIEHGIY